MSNEIQNVSKEIQDKVRELAYLMWESAGRQQGMAMSYWLTAEKDILDTMQTAAETVMPAEQKASKGGKAAPAPAAATAKPTAAKPAGKPAARKTAPRKKTSP